MNISGPVQCTMSINNIKKNLIARGTVQINYLALQSGKIRDCGMLSHSLHPSFIIYSNDTGTVELDLELIAMVFEVHY